MSDQDKRDQGINDLARRQAVQEERGDGMRREFQQEFRLLREEMQRGFAQLVARMEVNEARMEANEAKMDAKVSAIEASVARLHIRIVLWVVGWVTALALLAFAVAEQRYLVDRAPTAAQDAQAAQQAAQSGGQLADSNNRQEEQP